MKKSVRSTLKTVLCLVLALALCTPSCGLSMGTTEVQAAYKGAEFTCPEDLYLIYSTEYAIAPGVVETQYVTNTADGNDQEMGYAVTIDLSNPTVSIGAGYANNDGSTWAMQTVRKQAVAAEKDNGYNVVAAVNADFFNMATGCPSGPLVMKGVTYHKSNSPYFAILKDGSAVIRNGGGITDDVLEAVGGSTIMLINGEIPTGFADAYYTGKEPRTAVGIKADGTVVLFVGDGRQYPKSGGLTIYELAKMMKGLGCITAMNLDGGGSSTFLTEREGESDLVLHNSPSDGAEREVSSSLFVFSTAKSDGIFDHAVLSPNNNAYTPFSSVQFEAAGVDKAGCNADMPAGLTYALSDASESMGSITADGLFISNGDEGTVEVELMDGNKCVGTTSIDIIAPNYIGFSNEEVSFGFSQSSDLGLVVKADGRDLITNDSDFIWSMSDSSMGSFNGNIFTSSDSATVTGTITCTYKYNTAVSGSVTAIIGKLPTVVWDFENPDDYAGLYTSNYGRGSVESCELVTIDDDEPVRFGKGSLKLNYNFINCGAVTEGACVGMTDTIEIPGVPTGIGVWVYAPEGTATTRKQRDEEGLSGFWLRGYFTDGAGRQQAFDYTLEPKQVDNDLDKAGIYWEGWHYCEADLTKYAAPYSIQPGMTFRLMYVAGTKMGTKTAGAIYFDNLQFVYGANVDDIDVPVIDTIQGNETEITDGMVFDTNTITFTSTFHDVENKYTTGIDYDVVRMYIDGVNVVEDDMYILDKGGNKSWFYDVNLANGEHSIKMLVRDGFGNEITETRFFTVDAADNAATTVTLEPAEGTAPVLGESFTLNLTSNDIADITSATVGIKVGDDFALNGVEFAPGFTGTYSVKSKVLIITAEGSAASDSNVIASVSFNVPADLSSSIAFTYYTTLGSFETVKESGKTDSFAVATKKIAVTAPITINVDTFIVGCEGTISVTDTEGAPCAGAMVYQVTDSGNVLLGQTDMNGELVTTALSAASGKYTVFATVGAAVSYNTFVYAVNAVGTAAPYDIISNAVVDGNASKSISWFSNVLESEDKAIAQVAIADEYAALGDAAFVEYVGTVSDRVFTSGSVAGYSIVRANNVEITGLVAGETYMYRVGDGNVWSDVNSFAIDAEDKSVNFFIIGDIQAKDLENNTKVINGILGKGIDYAFGLQTGDAVDGGAVYSYWNELLGSYNDNGLQNIDMIHVLGNHEYEGDGEAENSVSIYDLPAAEYYSVEYDNVYVAVINYKSTDVATFQATADWLVEDASKSNAQWKILAMHQPPYFTNIAGGGKFINENLPAYIEAAGINMVFSGHDHTLARTLPMIGGKVDDNGVVYYICGSTGEKSYAAFNTPEFNFAYTNDTFDAVYTTVQIDAGSISVVNYDLDGSILDSYIMTNACGANGHDYSYSDGKMICDNCGIEISAASFTGFTKDAATGRLMYLIGGTPKTGIMTYADSEYLFDENGLGIDGEYAEECKIGSLVYTVDNGLVVDKNGLYLFSSRRGVYKGFKDGQPAIGWTELNGNWYYFDAEGKLYITSKRIGEAVYDFDEFGVYQGPVFYTSSKGTRYYDREQYAIGWTEIDGSMYFFESNGYMVTGRVLLDGNVYDFTENGILEKDWQNAYTGFLKVGKESFYYLNGSPVTGWYQIDGIYYYFNTETAVMATKNTSIGGVSYKFAADGSHTEGTFKVGGKGTRYYFAGQMITGWYTIDDNTYYFDSEGYMAKGSVRIDDMLYDFDENGVLLGEGKSFYSFTGFITEGKNTYYVENGEKVTGWKTIDGNIYYFNAEGVMATKTLYIGGVAYNFNSDGTYTKGTWKIGGKGTRFYFAGDYLTGWNDIEGSTYYFDGEGYMATGTVEIDGEFCIFDENGAFIGKEATFTGFVTEGKNTYYYVNNVMMTGWTEIDGSLYYFNTTTGAMAVKTTSIGGIAYKFNADGTHTEGTWKTYTSGTRYYFAGSMAMGWTTIGTDTYYFNENGYMVTGYYEIDGLFYEFDANGILLGQGVETFTGFTTQGKETFYYEDSVLVTGWKLIDGSYYYFNGNGVMSTKTTYIGGIGYKFNADGTHTEGTWKVSGKGNQYFFAGSMLTGWQTIDGVTYYFDESGYMATGITLIDGLFCEFAADGAYIGSTAEYTGFMKVGSVQYYFINGVKAVGWTVIDGNTYYFKADGAMATKNISLGGVTYKINADGTHTEGTWKTGGRGTQYFFAGCYAVGLNTIEGNLYYFNELGYKLTSTTVEVDGVTYIIDENGYATVYVPEIEEEIVEGADEEGAEEAAEETEEAAEETEEVAEETEEATEETEEATEETEEAAEETEEAAEETEEAAEETEEAAEEIEEAEVTEEAAEVTKEEATEESKEDDEETEEAAEETEEDAEETEEGTEE